MGYSLSPGIDGGRPAGFFPSCQPVVVEATQTREFVTLRRDREPKSNHDKVIENLRYREEVPRFSCGKRNRTEGIQNVNKRSIVDCTMGYVTVEIINLTEEESVTTRL